MMDADGFEQAAKFDAIYLGAIGSPPVPDHIAVWDLLLPLRQRFQQYVNLRPDASAAGLTSPLANRTSADIDMVCVRENSEGEYSGLGGRIHVGTPYEAAEQTGLFTRHGIESILRYGFEIAAKRPRKLIASATKSNALRHAMVLWDEVAESSAKDYPSVEYRKYHVDAIAARMITHPGSLDVIVCSNLFGDILTDIGSAISGSLGIAPGANINPERTHPVDVRTDSWIGAGYRRQRHRQSDRRDLGRGDDARPPRSSRCARSNSGRGRARRRRRQDPDAGSRRQSVDARAGRGHCRRNPKCVLPWRWHDLLAVFLATASRAQEIPAPAAADLPFVLSKAASYVELYGSHLSGLVMEESYVQDVEQINRFGTARIPAAASRTGSSNRICCW